MRRIVTMSVLLASVAGAAFAQDSGGLTPQRVFQIVDRDRNGVVSFEEAAAANSNWTRDVVAQFDADGSGDLSLAEFMRLFAEGPTPPGL